ncbi:beta-ketoacyl synthase N-terminal-like domain-containing protein [Algoriphagus halophilus]|uniref:beta-ketoacyl synthase N-terminal-like domain-containing protein n=1 Tax=Algoriphagus halophilus TaxID=226505 RepID=UPI00358FF53A
MDINYSLKKTPIAVIGLSAMFADAKNIEEYWTNIIQSKDSIQDVPSSRWLIDDYYDEDVNAPDKTYCKRGGFLPEIDFNPMEFGLPPNILEVTDVSQLLGLVAARDAFEDAGYGRSSTKFTKELKEKTGVLLGVGGGQKLITPLVARLQYPIWERALRASGIAEKDIPMIVAKMKSAYVGWNENAFPGLLGNVISGRISNRFDLGGINSVVDAACAASLSAIKMSLSELVEGRCDMMLTGGVDTDNSPFMYMSFSKTPAFSKSGKISPFSEKADGMLIGEGIGMLVLKRLADAEKDGDQIYSVIKGVGAASDGRFKSVYAPRPSGQALAMSRAYEDAGYPANTVGLLEAHGTGTNAGDAAELTSTQDVFGSNHPPEPTIAIGSVKSQIGHTKAAAGAAGIIKMTMALYHNVLPPSINVDSPNKNLKRKGSAIYLNSEARPWFKNGNPRRAGVSAFGFGGINLHITMEEYQGTRSKKYRLHEPNKIILFQSSNPSELHKVVNEKLALLVGSESEKEFIELANQSKKTTIIPQHARLGFVARSSQECIEILKASISRGFDSTAWNHPKGVFYRTQGINVEETKVAALFAGQGSQYVGMGRELANTFPSVARTFQKADQLFESSNSNLLSKKIFPIPVFTEEERVQQQKELTKTQFAQPAIGALSIGQFKILKEAGFSPNFTAGHSFGELTALWAAGVFDETTFLKLAKTRGEAMAINNVEEDSGTMLAVKADVQQVTEAIKNIEGVKIANINSDDQVVLGGGTPSIKIAEEQLKSKGLSVMLLPVSAAFHTDFVKHAQLPFSKFVDQQNFNPSKIPVYSNTTGRPYPVELSEIKSILKNQIINPVLFKDQIENLYQAGVRVFIEFGPKGILTNLVTNILKGKEHVAISINANDKKDSDLLFRQAIVQMQVLGIALSDIDPYKKNIPQPPEKSKLTVALSGNNFISPSTKKAYFDMMNNDFQISKNEIIKVEKTMEKDESKIIKNENTGNSPIQNRTQVNTGNEINITNKEVFQLLKSTIDSLSVNQAKSMELIEGYLNDQRHQSQALLSLFSQYLNLSNRNEPMIQDQVLSKEFAKATPLNSDKINHKNDISISENLNNVKNFAENGVIEEGVKSIKRPILSPNGSTNKTSKHLAQVNPTYFSTKLLNVVSEKTGYPIEMLELNMDMEADLGIDSIKRVEIFGVLTKQNPEISGINPKELTELRTLAQIVDFVSSHFKGNPETNQPVSEKSISSPPTTDNTRSSNEEVAPSIGNEVDPGHFQNTLLQVVSEKTGYPVEMLELNMDMEADLGIDSIKRVEIFGVLTKQNPEISGINPKELTELRTLAQIVDFVSSHFKGNPKLISLFPKKVYPLPQLQITPVLQMKRWPQALVTK